MRTLLFLTSISISLSLLPACTQFPPARSGTITHVVICYLKQPADRAARQKLIDASK